MTFMDGPRNIIEGECVPLRLLTERKVVTEVGEVCVRFLDDDAQEFLELTYNTSSTDYAMSDIQVYYGPDAAHVPSDGVGKPDPKNFQNREDIDGAQVAVMTIQLDAIGIMTCPHRGMFHRYIVAHATVYHLEGPVDVYANDNILYVYNDADQRQRQFFSYWKLNFQCREGGFGPREPGPNYDAATIGPTEGDTYIMTDFPTEDLTLAPTEAPAEATSSPTELLRAQISSMFPRENLAPSSAPSSSPTSAPSLLDGEDLVVGMSFIIITPTSQAVDDLPQNVVHDSFVGFARNVMADMHVQPLYDMEAPGRRELWVKYYNTSFKVYDFLVNEDCLDDEHLQAIAKTSGLRPAPERSQCHRAYARMTVRIAGEDPVEVCENLRQGTLAGYQQGRLQDVHVELNPNSPLRLQPGDFEYCVPVDEFTVPDHGEEHWAETNPLTNLTIIEDEEPEDDKTWLWIVLLGAGLLLVLLCLLGSYLYAQKKRKHDKTEAKMSSVAEDTEDEALVS